MHIVGDEIDAWSVQPTTPECAANATDHDYEQRHTQPVAQDRIGKHKGSGLMHLLHGERA